MHTAPEERSAFHDTLAARGVSRRDFVRFCGSIALMIGLAETAAPRIASAIGTAAATPLKPAIWLSQGMCTGCTTSVAQSEYPDVGRIVLDVLSVNYWETLSAGAGSSVLEASAKTVADSRGSFILFVEGALMRGFDGNALRVAGRPAIEDFKTIAAAAEAVVAVGSCAVDGGWVKADPNPADATGVMSVIDPKKVINLPTCPVNPEWVVAMLVDYLVLGKLPVVDAERRPTLIFGQTVHDDCPRRGHFENDEFVEAFGTTEETRGFCLYKMGCKGPQTKVQCPLVRWNARTSWCVESGSPCIGCANFDWVDRDAPFLQRMPDTLGVSPQTVGVVAGGIALAGLVAHGVAQTATGRMGHGGPPEEGPDPLESASAPSPADDTPGPDGDHDIASSEEPTSLPSDGPAGSDTDLDWTVGPQETGTAESAEEAAAPDAGAPPAPVAATVAKPAARGGRWPWSRKPKEPAEPADEAFDWATDEPGEAFDWAADEDADGSSADDSPPAEGPSGTSSDEPVGAREDRDAGEDRGDDGDDEDGLDEDTWMSHPGFGGDHR